MLTICRVKVGPKKQTRKTCDTRTRRHLNLVTATYIYIVPVPGGSGVPAISATTDRNVHLLPIRAWALGGCSDFPRNQNVLVTSRQQPLPWNRLEIRIWSPGATWQLPAAPAQRSDFCLRDHEEENSGSSEWNVSSSHEDVQNPCSSQSSSALKQQTVTLQISVCLKPLQPLKKATECIIYCKHAVSTWSLECFHMPPILVENWL